jgi:hypothetical protein
VTFEEDVLTIGGESGGEARREGGGKIPPDERFTGRAHSSFRTIDPAKITADFRDGVVVRLPGGRRWPSARLR